MSPSLLRHYSCLCLCEFAHNVTVTQRQFKQCNTVHTNTTIVMSTCFDPSALYPELLFALDGYAGDIFVSDAEPREQPSPAHVSLALSPDVAVDDTPTRYLCMSTT